MYILSQINVRIAGLCLLHTKRKSEHSTIRHDAWPPVGTGVMQAAWVYLHRDTILFFENGRELWFDEL